LRGEGKESRRREERKEKGEGKKGNGRRRVASWLLGRWTPLLILTFEVFLLT